MDERSDGEQGGSTLSVVLAFAANLLVGLLKLGAGLLTGSSAMLSEAAHSVALYAGDIGDAHPPVDPQVPLPLHMVGLARLDMPLIDGAEVEELAAVCAELGRYAFLLSVAPPRLRGATGVPVNPQAIF